jgi:hypothetical protein
MTKLLKPQITRAPAMGTSWISRVCPPRSAGLAS